METITFKDGNLYELISYLISAGIDWDDKELIEAARKIERTLEDTDFIINAKANGCKFELNY